MEGEFNMERSPIFKDCAIENVYTRVSARECYHEYMVHIRVCDEDVSPVEAHYYISFNRRSDLYGELVKLSKGAKERVYSAFGMSNIDFWYDSSDKKYCIEWSPYDGVYFYFFVKKQDFEENFINVLMPSRDES